MSQAPVILKSDVVDFSHLVGRELRILTEQYPGKTLISRVVSVTDKSLVIDRSGSNGLVDQLVNRQNIEVHFENKGQPVVLFSRITVPREGKVEIPFDEKIVPLMRRRFIRHDYGRDLRLTYFDLDFVKTVRLNKLKWFETAMLNIGGGGLLINMPTHLSQEHYLILNIELEEFELPRLILGRVRHCHSDGHGNLTGVEFIVQEEFKNVVQPELLKNLSGTLFQFDRKLQVDLARHLEEKFRESVI